MCIRDRTKYYSELSALEEEQKELLRSTTAVLLEAGLVFPYFKTLAKYVPMPEDIMDKAMIQYHSCLLYTYRCV